MKLPLAFLAVALPLAAQSAWTERFGGYFKNLASGSQSYFTQDSWADDLTRLRLTYDARDAGWLQIHVDYDNEVHAGSLIEQPDFSVIRHRQSDAWLDLQHVFVNADHAYWDTSLYRGTVALHHGPATLTLGRQRIGWGTARFWSPMDVFNPISPLQIESDERQGVDAALLELAAPGKLRWSLVYAPQNGFRRSSSAVRLGRTIHNYDFDVMTGRFQQDWMVGADYAGQLRGAGLRGEVTYRWRHAQPTANALRVTLGADYAFPNTLYLVAEYFYNQGQPATPLKGVLDPSVLLRFSNEIFTLHRHFLSTGATYDLTPLWHASAYVVTDLAGPSAAVLPSIRHSLATNIDVTLGAQLFASSRGTEFDGLSNLAYLEFLFHF